MELKLIDVLKLIDCAAFHAILIYLNLFGIVSFVEGRWQSVESQMCDINYATVGWIALIKCIFNLLTIVE